MSTWGLYRGTGIPRKNIKFPEPPPWRRFRGTVPPEDRRIEPPDDRGRNFIPAEGLLEAVNAALYLRRPLMVTGAPGSGKSTLIHSVARELGLGRVLEWSVTSSSTLQDAQYRYDAIARLQSQQLGEPADIENFLTLGPLGTAFLPTQRPRALLVDEIDKSDIDLPNDLLNAFETGRVEVPVLKRMGNDRTFYIEEDGGSQRFPITGGVIECREFPFVVLTSNGERDFPPAFLRRCIRFHMPPVTAKLLKDIVRARLGAAAGNDATDLIEAFAARIENKELVATDQLLNAVYIVTRRAPPDTEPRRRLLELLQRELVTDRE